MYESFIKLENKIFDTYYALSEAELNGNKAKYKRMYRRLKRLLKTENVYKNHPIFSMYLVSFSEMYDQELESISCESEQELISYMIKTRINNIMNASVLMSNSEFVTDSFESDIAKRTVILFRKRIDSEGDIDKKRKMLEQYYLYISINPSLESEFVTSSNFVDVQSVNFLGTKQLFRTEYENLEENKIEEIENSIMSILDSIIYSSDELSDLDEFTQNILEFTIRAYMSYLPKQEYGYMKTLILNYLESVKGFIPLTTYYRVRGLFDSYNIGHSKVYRFPDINS